MAGDTTAMTAPSRTESPAEVRDTSPLSVPPLLRDAAAWTWRVLLLALAGYLLVGLLDRLAFLVLPLIAALLAAALVMPVTLWLRRRGLGRGLSAWLTVLLGLLVIAGIFFFVVNRAIAESTSLVDQLSSAVDQTRNFLTGRLGVKTQTVNNVGDRVVSYLDQHRSTIASGVVSGASVIGEVLAGFVLWFFLFFFFIYEGDRIWGWVVGLFPHSARDRVRGSGAEAWQRLAGYVRGTFVIAVFHGVVVGLTLLVMGVPLVAPLALLVFVGSFIPIVGAFVFGGLAVLVTFVTHGIVLAVVLVGVLVLDNQAEAHLLQPFLVGRYVRLHPVAVAVGIAGGTVLEGIYGTILAVPVIAAVYAIASYLVRSGRSAQQSSPDGGDPGSGPGGPRGSGGGQGDGSGGGDGGDPDDRHEAAPAATAAVTGTGGESTAAPTVDEPDGARREPVRQEAG